MFGLGGSFNHSSSQNQFQNQSDTTQNGTSATARTLLPGQSQSASDLYTTLHNYMTNPQAAVNPARMAQRNQVNNTYAGLADRVRQQFLTTGGGASGKAGQADLAGEIGRAGGLADADNTAAVQASQLPLTAAALANQFLGINFGQTSSMSGTSDTTQSGTSSGSDTGFGISAGIGNK